MFAVNQSQGIWPVWSDCENNFDKMGAISVAQCFKIQAGILSGPEALLVSSSLSSCRIPSIDIETGGIVG